MLHRYFCHIVLRTQLHSRVNWVIIWTLLKCTLSISYWEIWFILVNSFIQILWTTVVHTIFMNYHFTLSSVSSDIQNNMRTNHNVTIHKLGYISYGVITQKCCYLLVCCTFYVLYRTLITGKVLSQEEIIVSSNIVIWKIWAPWERNPPYRRVLCIYRPLIWLESILIKCMSFQLYNVKVLSISSCIKLY